MREARAVVADDVLTGGSHSFMPEDRYFFAAFDEDGAGIRSDPTEPAIAKPKASTEIVMVPLKE
jgi:hypothetical protein